MTRILVPVDGSEPSEAGLEYARETFPDAMITALYVVHLAGYWSGFTANVEAMPGYEEAKAEGEEISHVSVSPSARTSISRRSSKRARRRT